MNLFDFDFSKELTKEDLEKAVSELAEFSKQIGNPRYLFKDYIIGELGDIEEVSIPVHLHRMLPRLISEGYVTLTPNGLILDDRYKEFHTIPELIERFREVCHDYLNRGGHAYGLYSIRTAFSLRYHLKTEEEQKLFYQSLERELSKIQRSLGLIHFLEVPNARGRRMNILNDRSLRKIRRIMAEELVNYTDYQRVLDYFKHHGVYRGEFKYNKNASWIDHSKIPKLDVIVLMPTDFEAQCVAEAMNTTDIELVMDYMGCTNPKSDKEIILINSNGERKRFLKNRDLKKTFVELPDAVDSSNEQLIERLFSSFNEDVLDELLC